MAKAKFDSACRIVKNGFATATPIVHAFSAKLPVDAILGYDSLVIAGNSLCDGQFDWRDADSVTQHLFDIAGQVTALVIKAQEGP